MMIFVSQIHKFVLCTLAILFLFFAPAGYSQEYARPAQLKFVFSSPPENPLTQWLTLIYTDALERMNIEMVFIDVPPKRASYYSDNGIADAELSRVANYNKVHPNMIRVDEHNFYVNFVAYAASQDIQLNGWDSLKGTGYKVDYRLGIMKCEQQLPRVVEPKYLHATSDVMKSFKKLLAGRIDVYVDAQDLAEGLLKTDEFKQASGGKKVYRIGLMEQITGHAFLHKKHKELIPELSAILKEMKEEGLFLKYLNQVGLTEAEVNW